MEKRHSLALALIAVLILSTRCADAQVTFTGSGSTYVALLQGACRRLLPALLYGRSTERLRAAFLFNPRADGGGGGGDGGGGDGGGDGGSGSGGDGGGAGSGTGAGDGGNGGGTSGVTGAPGASGDQGTQGAPSNNVAPAPANDNPAAPDAPTGSTDNNAVGGADNGLPGVSAPGAAVDVAINAVIVSGAPTPWEAIGKIAGARNVIVTGGIIALGEIPLAKLPAGVIVGSPNSPPGWLKFKPDLRLLNGSVFPPVVPNVIDIRIMSYTEEAIENPQR